jgi:flagellar protein FlbD
VVILTRLNGHAFALNPDLVERAESTPDTVITLVDGTKYVVMESVPELIERIRDYRASVVSAAGAYDLAPAAHHDTAHGPAAPDGKPIASPVLRLHRES